MGSGKRPGSRPTLRCISTSMGKQPDCFQPPLHLRERVTTPASRGDQEVTVTWRGCRETHLSTCPPLTLVSSLFHGPLTLGGRETLSLAFRVNQHSRLLLSPDILPSLLLSARDLGEMKPSSEDSLESRSCISTSFLTAHKQNLKQPSEGGRKEEGRRERGKARQALSLLLQGS